MKLIRRLSIGGTEYPVIEDRVILELSAIGRAEFTINSNGADIANKSAVSFSVGYSQHDGLQQIFEGYIEDVTKVDAKKVHIFCREWLGALAYSIPLSLRHPDMKEVLGIVTEKTGIQFSVPDEDYATKKIPNFVNIGSGLHLLKAIGEVFEVDDFIYQQQGDGVVYVGSWQHCRWNGRDVDIEDHHFDEQISNKSARLAISPVLRPAVVLNGKRLKSIEYSGNFMTVTAV